MDIKTKIENAFKKNPIVNSLYHELYSTPLSSWKIMIIYSLIHPKDKLGEKIDNFKISIANQFPSTEISKID